MNGTNRNETFHGHRMAFGDKFVKLIDKINVLYTLLNASLTILDEYLTILMTNYVPLQKNTLLPSAARLGLFAY